VPDPAKVRRARTEDLTTSEITAIRELLVAAFGTDHDEAFTDDDWEHAVGGLHFVCDLGGVVVAHASVVERTLHVGATALRTGYVEAVATAPDRQGAGFGSLVMAEANAYIRDAFELGGLGTGRQTFYERLGWRIWTGPTAVRTKDGERSTPDEDGSIMVLTTPTSPPLDLNATIMCEWRPGDAW
jgi:aminoglycoside 2'-N-acetyltransferase I